METMEAGDEERVAPKRAAAPSTSFKGCRPALSQEVLEVVKEMGFESMTPVQVRVCTQHLFLLSLSASLFL